MKPQLIQPFIKYSIDHEGFTPFMYCDVLNLVTTGIGNLIDAGPNNPGPDSATRARLNNVVSAGAMAPAMGLPWKHKGAGWSSKNPIAGAPLSPGEVAAAWTATKRQNENVPDFSQRGGFAYAGLTDATLDMQGIQDLVQRTITSFNKTLVSRYPDFDAWPLDAQFAVMSFSWANGPAFQQRFPQFNAALLAQDFAAAVTQGQFKGGGSVNDAGDPSKGRPASRNHDNAIMFANADTVVKGGGDRDLLIFPVAGGSVKPSGGITPAQGAQGAIAGVSATAAGLKATAKLAGKTAAVGGVVYGGYRLLKHWGWF